MTISLINPKELPTVPFFRQVSIATGSKLVFMAGQVAWTKDGALVGDGDLAAQVEQCFLNVGAALAEAGGSFDNVVKLTTFVVDWSMDKMTLVSDGRAEPAGSTMSVRQHRLKPSQRHRNRGSRGRPR